MNDDVREKALAILARPAEHSPSSIHNAIVDVRRSAKPGDEALLGRFLDHSNEMVVSATLFALIHVYKPEPGRLSLLLHYAEGDHRDTGEMPIQTQAIEGLCLFSRTNPEALSKLMTVAKNAATTEAPRARAWKCLAELFGVPWERAFTTGMIDDPDAPPLPRLEDAILAAIDARQCRPMHPNEKTSRWRILRRAGAKSPAATGLLRHRLELAGHLHDPFEPPLRRQLRLDLLRPQREGER